MEDLLAFARSSGGGDGDEGSPWEMGSILAEVATFAGEQKELEALAQAQELSKSVRDTYKDTETEASEAVSACEDEASAARARAEAFAAQTPTSPEIEALERERMALLKRLDEASTAEETTMAMVAELEKRVQAAEDALKAAKNSEDAAMPLMKHSLSLYASISKIKWDFAPDAQKKGIFAGSVVDAEEGYVRNFEIDERNKSQFQIANQLWDLINAA
mmetsp:Transcript_22768/g.44725  ORF Transcript_22768/g.44725 Transcript_22768/m.44725 type:complete len:218 (-) Transcript_22768:535-1188(-)|eukprot:CAMPEP_0171495062 /NCGR_PEP_ID=MMETSP0958-20121227/5914_1 /TAXON_ID=87120 /ORGANISM="Aurantiochytrium limacinum, Strain ATCCMYA-1381" /LENGTH=217 /DNA_ID=CAMNT_0012028965 /DNA_START=109 /DNA_END=762 /DNA_ORIENTATION=-